MAKSSDKLNVENMFDKISKSFDKANKRGGSGVYKDILRFEKGKDYVVRLLPYRDDPEETIYHLITRGWKSKATGKYVEFAELPEGEVNPIQVYSSKLTEKLKPLKLDKDDPRMKRARELWTKDSWLINCYVISDPTNPDNEGEVKLLRLGKKLYDIVFEHVHGDRKDEYGLKCLDPRATGCNFKIKVVDNGAGYANYDKSYFMQPSEIEGVSDNPEKIGEIFDACVELKTLFPIKTPEELEEAIKVHFEGEVDEAPSSFSDIDSVLGDSSEYDEEEEDELDEDEEYDEEEEEIVEKKPKKKAVKKTTKKSSDDDDDSLDALLADL